MARHGMHARHKAAPIRRLFHPAGAAMAESQAESSTREYTVLDGDTFSSVARAHGIPTAALLAMNGLSWSSGIAPGQRLSVPAAAAAPGEHVNASDIVKHRIDEGETVTAIAARYGVTRMAVLSANGLHATSLIFIGQVLLIPAVSVDTRAMPAIQAAAG